jgi:ABC-2 type transport system permease protein
MRSVRAYAAYFSARFRMQLQYRFAALAGIGTQIFFGLINVMVLTAFYSSGERGQPLTYAEAVSYVWLAQSLLLVVPFRLDHEVGGAIISGNVAYELAKPIRLQFAWLARALADRTAPVMLRALPQVVFSALVLRWVGWSQIALRAPASGGALAVFFVSVLAGIAVSAALGLVANATLFWTISANGTSLLFSTMVWVLSGITIPLPLFPDWFQPVLSALPFRAMLDTPFRIYLGTLGGGEAWAGIALQIGWAAALFCGGWLMIERGMRRVEIQGG